MKTIYLCDGTVPKCCNSAGCGLNSLGECFHTTNVKYALLKKPDEERHFDEIDEYLVERKPKAIVKAGRLPDAPEPTLPVHVDDVGYVDCPRFKYKILMARRISSVEKERAKIGGKNIEAFTQQ